MKNVERNIPENAALEEAWLWLTRLESDELSSEQKREFQVWLDSNPRHGAAYDQISHEY